MPNINELRGLQTVLRNMATRIGRVETRWGFALKAAGLLLQRESQKLVPVDFGFLKASAYTRATGTGLATVVQVGYTASYAVYVHEAVGMVLKGQPRRPNPPHKGRYWDPQGQTQAKFLEQPWRTMRKPMLQLIKDTIGKV